MAYSPGYGGVGSSYAWNITPTYVVNQPYALTAATNSTLMVTNAPPSFASAPARERTAREWLAEQVESVCRAGRL